MGREGIFITDTDLLIDGVIIASIAAGRYQLHPRRPRSGSPPRHGPSRDPCFVPPGRPSSPPAPAPDNPTRTVTNDGKQPNGDQNAAEPGPAGLLLAGRRELPIRRCAAPSESAPPEVLAQGITALVRCTTYRIEAADPDPPATQTPSPQRQDAERRRDRPSPRPLPDLTGHESPHPGLVDLGRSATDDHDHSFDAVNLAGKTVHSVTTHVMSGQGRANEITRPPHRPRPSARPGRPKGTGQRLRRRARCLDARQPLRRIATGTAERLGLKDQSRTTIWSNRSTHHRAVIPDSAWAHWRLPGGAVVLSC